MCERDSKLRLNALPFLCPWGWVERRERGEGKKEALDGHHSGHGAQFGAALERVPRRVQTIL